MTYKQGKLWPLAFDNSMTVVAVFFSFSVCLAETKFDLKKNLAGFQCRQNNCIACAADVARRTTALIKLTHGNQGLLDLDLVRVRFFKFRDPNKDF